MAPRRLGPPDRGDGLFTDVLNDYFYLGLLLAARHVVDLVFNVIFVLALATIELVWLAVLEGDDGIVAIPPVEDVITLGVEALVIAVASVDDIVAVVAKQPYVVARPAVDNVVASSSEE